MSQIEDDNPISICFIMLADPLSFPLAILRQETFVLSECSGFGASGRARRRKSERGKADDGREEGVGDQSRRGSFVDKRPGCLSLPPPLPLCVPASTDGRPTEERECRFCCNATKNNGERKEERRTNEGRSERRGGLAANRRCMHFLPHFTVFLTCKRATSSHDRLAAA